MDIRSLHTTVHELFTAGLALAILKVYKTGNNRYNSFCVCYNVSHPFTVSEDVLMSFVAYLYKEGLKVGTIKSYPAGIRHAQIALGLGNPHIEEMCHLEYVIRRVKRRTNGPTCSRYPITVQLLAQMHRFWCVEKSDRDSAMLWATAAMCFLDSSELERWWHLQVLALIQAYTCRWVMSALIVGPPHIRSCEYKGFNDGSVSAGGNCIFG